MAFQQNRFCFWFISVFTAFNSAFAGFPSTLVWMRLNMEYSNGDGVGDGSNFEVDFARESFIFLISVHGPTFSKWKVLLPDPCLNCASEVVCPITLRRPTL